MKYPEWWQRLVAGIIDGVIMAIVIVIVNAIFGAVAGYSLSALRVLGLIAVIVSTALIVGYKVFFEGGQWQATPGKMVFGLKVVDEAGNRLPYQQAFMRTWPWWLNLVAVLDALLITNIFNLLVALAIIAIFFTFFMQPVGRCLHDQTAKANVIVGGKGLAGSASGGEAG